MLDKIIARQVVPPSHKPGAPDKMGRPKVAEVRLETEPTGPKNEGTLQAIVTDSKSFFVVGRAPQSTVHGNGHDR